MKNKVVSLFTFSGERILCIILKECKDKYYYKSEFEEGYIFKDDIKEIEIIGDVVE